MRRFSPPLLFIVSFIDFLVFRYDNDNYRYLIVIDVVLGLSYRNAMCFDIQHQFHKSGRLC